MFDPCVVRFLSFLVCYEFRVLEYASMLRAGIKGIDALPDEPADGLRNRDAGGCALSAATGAENQLKRSKYRKLENIKNIENIENHKNT